MKIRKFTVVLVLAVFLLIPTACNKAGFAKKQPVAFQNQPTLEVQNIDLNEASSVIKNTIRLDYNEYELNLTNDNLSYNGDQYYQFVISDNNSTIGPSIIVSKNNGSILCYYSNHSASEVYQDGIFKSKC